jgi:hypothetical protein
MEEIPYFARTKRALRSVLRILDLLILQQAYYSFSSYDFVVVVTVPYSGGAVGSQYAVLTFSLSLNYCPIDGGHL